MVTKYKGGPGNYKSSYLTVAIQTVDHTVNNSETLVNHNTFSKILKAGARYHGILALRIISPSAADLDVTFATISGATWQEFGIIGGSVVNPIAFATELLIGTDASSEVVIIHFWLKTGSGGGTLQFKFAQGTATVGDSKVLKGSTMTVFED